MSSLADSAQHAGTSVMSYVNATAAARRAKKREQDRRSQRMARERTRNRLDYLEGKVAELKQQNATTQMQRLWEERDRIAAERDILAQTLRAVENAIQGGKKVLPTHPDLLPSPSANQIVLLPRQNGSVCINDSLTRDDCSSLSTSAFTPSQQAPHSAAETWSTCAPAGHSDGLYQLDVINADENAILAADSAQLTGLNMEWPGVDTSILCSQQQDTTVSAPTAACECLSAPTLAPHTNRQHLNLWRFANEILGAPVEWSPLISMKEDAFEEDTPIRALVEGWDAVEKRAGGSLPASWSKLRSIDETIFSTCAKIERLAIMRAMHSLFRYHQEPSLTRGKSMPKWYLARYAPILVL
jgi:hypothetical protein